MRERLAGEVAKLVNIGVLSAFIVISRPVDNDRGASVHGGTKTSPSGSICLIAPNCVSTPRVPVGTLRNGQNAGTSTRIRPTITASRTTAATFRLCLSS